MVSSQVNVGGIPKTTFGLWHPCSDSIFIQNIPLALLRCWESLPVWCCQRILGAERNWKQLKQVKKGDCTKTGVNKTSKQVLIYSQHQIMHGALRRTGLSMASKLWDDNDLATMKMDEYCKDLETQVGNFDKLI